MRVGDIVNEDGYAEKAVKINWPEQNYNVWVADIPYEFEEEELKVIKTTTEKLKNAYFNSFLKNRYDSPLYSPVADAHYHPHYRKQFEKLLVSNEGGMILPTGRWSGFVLSYVSNHHAEELAKIVREKEKAALAKDRKGIEMRNRKFLDKEKVRKASEEKRIPTGVRNTTVIDPSSFANITARTWKNLKVYSGNPNGVSLGTIQEKHYQTLIDILARNGKKFNYVGYASYEGFPAYNAYSKNNPTLTRFVMTAPGFVWEKYEGDTAGGGQNRVYVGGKMLKLTDFLRLPPNKQDVLIQRSKMVGKE